jgi:hypothetical protein
VFILATDDKLTGNAKASSSAIGMLLMYDDPVDIRPKVCAQEVVQALCHIRTASDGIRDILRHVVSRLGLQSQGCDTMPQALAASGPQ